MTLNADEFADPDDPTETPTDERTPEHDPDVLEDMPGVDPEWSQQAEGATGAP